MNRERAACANTHSGVGAREQSRPSPGQCGPGFFNRRANMSKRNSKVSTTTESAPAVERAGAPILLNGRELEAVAAAGARTGHVGEV
jgi:hypothetical protein